jgi:hypothetical protein
MKVINLFGGPGSGKSTTAAGIFYRMKQQHASIELVTEYAKDMVYDGQGELLRGGKHQSYIFARQHYRIQRLVGHVDWAVTDGPMLLTLVYMDPNAPDAEALTIMAKTGHTLYDNHNFYLVRPDTFQQYGRVHDETESRSIDRKILSMLEENNVPYTVVETGPTAVDDIIGWL